MNDPDLSIISGGEASIEHSFADWNRLLDQTATVAMHSETRPEPDAASKSEPGTVRTLCMLQPMSDQQRAAMKRDANAAAELSAKGPDLWKKWNGRKESAEQ